MATRDAIFNLKFELPNQKGVNDAANDIQKLRQNVDNAKKGSLEYVEAQKKLEAAQKRVDGSFKQTSKSASSFTQTMKGAVSSLAAFVAVGSSVQILRGAVNTIIDFEQSLADLSAITGATGGDLEFYAEKAREIGATTTLSASQAVEAFQLIGSASPALLSNSEALASVTQEAVTLAEAAGITLPEAAAALGNSLNAFRLPAEDASRIINTFAAGSKEGAREIPFITQAIEKFGASAAAAGIEIEESVAAIELLGKTQSDAAGVGTNLRNIITILRQEAAKQGREFKGLTGELEEYTDKLDDVNFLVKTFGRENINAFQSLASGREDLIALTEAVTDTTVAYDQQAIRTSTLSAELKGLASAYEGIVLSFRESTGAIASVIRFLRENLATLLKSVAVLAAGFLGYRAALLAVQAATVVARVATIAYTATKALFTGGVQGATVALRAFNVAIKSNPVGLIVGVLASAAAAFVAFRNKAKDATDQQKEFNAAIAEANRIRAAQQTIDQQVQILPTLSLDELEGLQQRIQQEVDAIGDISVGVRASEQNAQGAIDIIAKQVEDARAELELFRVGDAEFNEARKRLKSLERNLAVLKENARDITVGEFGFQSPEALKRQEQLQQSLAVVTNRLKQLRAEEQKAAQESGEGTIKALEERVKELRRVLVEDLRIDSKQFAPTVEAYKAAVEELKAATDLINGGETTVEEGSIVALQQRVNDLREVVNNTSGEAENFGQIVEELIQAQLELNNLQDRLKPIDRDKIRQEELKEEERHALALLAIQEAGEERQLGLKLAYARERLDALKNENEQEKLEYQKQFNEIVELEEQLGAVRRAIADQAAQDMRQRQLQELQGISEVLTASLEGLSQLIQGQQFANQQLISLQQSRVEDALAIADQGNAALLEAEEKRLNELQRKREQFVRNQQVLAAAQLVAESSLAIARAAAEGGAAAPFTIAATLIALTAGLAQARAAAQTAAAGFKSGGYTGDYGVNQEAGVVHGKEFVIDAPTTEMMGLRGKSMADFKEMMVRRSNFSAKKVDSSSAPLSDKQVAQIVDAIKSQPVPNFTFDENGIFTASERRRKQIERVKSMAK